MLGSTSHPKPNTTESKQLVSNPVDILLVSSADQTNTGRDKRTHPQSTKLRTRAIPPDRPKPQTAKFSGHLTGITDLPGTFPGQCVSGESFFSYLIYRIQTFFYS